MVCPVCKAMNSEKDSVYSSKNSFFDKTFLFRCLECDMRYAHPMPSQEEWKAFNEGYFANAHGGLNSSESFKYFSTGLAKIRLKSLQDFIALNKISISSVLEIGPGAGYLMDEMLIAYPEANYFVEESDQSLHHSLLSRGARLFNASSINQKKVDLIIATHVLEHTINPVQFLQNYGRFLNKKWSVVRRGSLS